LSVVSVVCCQVLVSAKSWSLLQRIPTNCGASLCDLKISWMRRPWPALGRSATHTHTHTKYIYIHIYRQACHIFWITSLKYFTHNMHLLVNDSTKIVSSCLKHI
jgi:hypothetical protein